MGTPENMTKEEINDLKGKTYPKMGLEYLKIKGGHKATLKIPVHGAQLITIERKL